MIGFIPLQLPYHKFWIESENRWMKLRITFKDMRIIDKKGIDVILADLREKIKLVSTATHVGGKKNGHYDQPVLYLILYNST